MYMFTKADVEAYFNAEKQAGLLFLMAGIVAVLLALFLLFSRKQQWSKGAAWPFLVVGLLMSVVGYSVFSKSDAQRKDIVYKMDMNTDAIATKEIPRMEKVMVNFAYYRYAEIAFLLTGLMLFIVFRNQPTRAWWTGLGLSLAFMAAVALIADGFAERRGSGYVKGLKEMVGKTN
jgi:hypothetical protein